MNSTNRLFVQQALLHDLRRSYTSVSFVTPVAGNNNNNNLLLTRIIRKRRSCENVGPITTTTTPIITTTFQRRTKTTLAVALSGGVDSSVAAALVQQQIDPTITQLQAVHMTNWNFQDESGGSSSNGSSSSSKDENMVLEKVCYEQDWNDAMKVAEHLQVPLIRQSLESEYWNHVFEPYLDELLQNGKMGNPDINCNVYIKFGALREKVLQRYGSQTWLVTGHYARLWYPQHGTTTMTCSNNKNSPLPLEDYKDLVESNLSLPQDEWLWNLMMTTTTTTKQQQPGRYSSKQPWLLAAADISKDQSYFLAGCSNVQLQQVLFPLGDLYKTTHDDNNNDDHRDKNNKNNTPNMTEKTQSSSSPPPPSSSSSSSTRTTTTRQTVRQVAAQLQLPTAYKRESMGICFIGKRKSWIDFMKEYTPKELLQPTIQFVDIDSGRILGQTNEPSHVALYTIGRGAKLSGVDQKYYVVHHRPSSINKNKNNKKNNIVWVCAGTHHPALYAKSLTVYKMNWILNGHIPDPLLQTSQQSSSSSSSGIVATLHCQCRIRHLQSLTNCHVVWNRRRHRGNTTTTTTNGGSGGSGDNHDHDVYTIYLDEPIRGITPGQMLVLYAAQGLVCLGGGPIAECGPTMWEEQEQIQEEEQNNHSFESSLFSLL